MGIWSMDDEGIRGRKLFQEDSSRRIESLIPVFMFSIEITSQKDLCLSANTFRQVCIDQGSQV